MHKSHAVPLLVLVAAVGIAYVERSAIAHVVPFIRREDGYDPVTMGYVLSGFGWGYVVGLPFSGYIISRYGHQKTLVAMALGWAGSAWAFSLSGSATHLAFARFALGLFEAPLFPLFVSWIALTSSRAASATRISIVEASSYLGLALSGPLIVLLANQYGWRAAYASTGVLALVVAIMGATFLKPARLYRPSDGQVAEPSDWSIASVFSISFVACGLGFLLYNFTKTFHSTWLPTILISSYDYSSLSAASLTFTQSIIAPIASILVGFCSSYILRKGFSIISARLIPMLFGFGAGSIVASAPFLTEWMSLVLILSFVGVISTSALIWSVPGDLTSDAARVAHASGFLNAIANIGTIASPIAVGHLIATTDGHVYALVLLGAISIMAFVLFCIGYLSRRNIAPRANLTGHLR